MLKNLLTNWKTTSAGIAMITSSVVHLIFSVKAKTADESTWTTALMGIVGGIGLLAAGDSSASAQAHADSTAAIQAIATAVKTGDTSILTKAEVPTTPSTKTSP